MPGYTRARPAGTWKNKADGQPYTQVDKTHLEKWDQKIYELATVIVNATDHGIVGDGIADDYSALLEAHDALPPGGILLVPPGTYKIGTQFNWSKDFSTIWAHGATFKTSAALDGIFDFSNVYKPRFIGGLFDFRGNSAPLGAIKVTSLTEDARIQDVTILHDGSAAATFKGIHVNNSFFTRIDGLRCNSTGGTGLFGGQGAVYLDGGGNATWVRESTFGSCVKGLNVQDANAVRSLFNAYASGTDGITLGDSANITGFVSAFDRFEANTNAILIDTAFAHRPPVKPCILHPFYTGNTNNVVNPNAIPLSGFTNEGFSTDGARVSNPNGSVVIADANTFADITFDITEPDSVYKVFLSAHAEAGASAADSRRAFTSGRGTTGFRINLQAAPGAGTSIRIFWRIER